MLIILSRSLPLLLTVLLAAFSSGVVHAQSDTGANSAAEDSTKAKTAVTSGRVTISIDGGGISVEGNTSGDVNELEEWVEVSDERGVYKVKGDDIVRFGEGVLVEKDELVRGDLLIFGGDAIVEGKVTGNVVVIGGSIRARSGAEIKGDAVSIGGDLDEDSDVVIHGERIEVHPFVDSGLFSGAFRYRTAWVSASILVGVAFVSLILFLLVVLFLRDRIGRAHQHLTASYLKSFGVGLLTLFVGFFAVSIVAIPLIISLIGIPIALLLFISCFGIWIISDAVFVFTVGGIVARRMNLESSSPFLRVAIGLLIMTVPEILALAVGVIHSPFLAPFHLTLKSLSVFLWLFASVSGLGALALSRFGARALNPVPSGPVPTVGTETI